MNVADQLLRARDVEPMKSVDRRDDVVVTGEIVLPTRLAQIGNDDRPDPRSRPVRSDICVE